MFKPDEPGNNCILWQIIKRAAGWLMPVGLLAVTSCSSTPAPSAPARGMNGNPYLTANAGYRGQTVVETITRRDTVVSIDAASRTVELRHPDGQVATYKAEPQTVPFDQIKPGDQIEATVTEETTLFLVPANSPQGISTNMAVTRAAVGATPHGPVVQTRTYTARILAIYPAQNQVTLQLANGQNKTITPPVTVNLADFKPGERVSARVTEPTLISVGKPKP